MSTSGGAYQREKQDFPVYFKKTYGKAGLKSLMALAAKFIQVVFGIIKPDKNYDPAKTLSDIKWVKHSAA